MNPREPERRYTIAEAAELLDRSPHTLRSWDRTQAMPAELRPPRDDYGHRYWTDDLIAKIKEWIVANNFHPGSAIQYRPTPEQLTEHIHKVRAARSSKANESISVLRNLIEDAMDSHGVPADHIITMIPDVVARLNREQGYDIKLDAALRVASEVIGGRSS